MHPNEKIDVNWAFVQRWHCSIWCILKHCFHSVYCTLYSILVNLSQFHQRQSSAFGFDLFLCSYDMLSWYKLSLSFKKHLNMFHKGILLNFSHKVYPVYFAEKLLSNNERYEVVSSPIQDWFGLYQGSSRHTHGGEGSNLNQAPSHDQ